MRKINLFFWGLFLVAMFVVQSANGQIAITVTNPGNTTPALASSYTSLAAAITAMNGRTAMSGPVIFTLTDGGTETAPAAGYVLGNATLNALTSAINTITFQKSGSGTNPLLTAFTGTSTTVDGIWKIAGTDYVTITNIDLQESASNDTPTKQMEWGYAIVKLSLSDGSQNINITGCTVTLNKTNTVSKGIYGGNHTATATTGLLVASAAGTNANIKINGCTVSNCYIPINIAGYTTLQWYDTGLEIGTTTKNTVSNYGGGSVTTSGIYITGQNAPKIENNTVSLGTGTTGTAYGINVATACIGYLKINMNTVSVSSSALTSDLVAISNLSPIASTLDITNNTIQNCSYTTATTAAAFYGIYEQAATTGCTVNILGNTVTGTNYSDASLAGSGSNSYIYISGGTPDAVNVNNNYIYNNTRTGNNGGITRGIHINKGAIQTVDNNHIYSNTIDGTGAGGQFFGIQSATTTGTVVLSSNQIYNNQITKTTATNTINGIYSSAPATSETFSGNTIYGNTTAGTGAVYGIYKTSGTAVDIFGNNIYSLSNTNSTTVAVNVYGIYFQGPTVTGTSNIYGNFIHDLSINASNTSTTAALYGIQLDNSTTAGDGALVIRNTYNNIISLGNGVNNNCLIYGIQQTNVTNTVARTNNIYFNTVYIAGSPASASVNTMALNIAGTSASNVRNIRNNIFMNARSGNSSGAKHYAAYFTDITGVTVNYNDYYVSGTGGTIGYWPSADITTWPNANLGNNSLNTNPQFTDPDANGTAPEDFKSTNNSLRGTGVTIEGYSTDYNGFTRLDPPSLGGIENDNPLPVELSSFISNVNGRNVKLIWVTASEQNNTGFDIERKTVSGTWAKISFVQGKGTVSIPSNYSFEDRNLNTGRYNYRLKQIDNNGNFEYHNLNTVLEVGLPAKFLLSQNYPNPFNPVTKIDYQLPADGKVSIRIYDMTGREVKTLLKNEQRSAGYYTIDFNGSSMSSGIYFYRFIAESNGKQTVMTKKLMLIK